MRCYQKSVLCCCFYYNLYICTLTQLMFMRLWGRLMLLFLSSDVFFNCLGLVIFCIIMGIFLIIDLLLWFWVVLLSVWAASSCSQRSVVFSMPTICFSLANFSILSLGLCSLSLLRAYVLSASFYSVGEFFWEQFLKYDSISWILSSLVSYLSHETCSMKVTCTVFFCHFLDNCS